MEKYVQKYLRAFIFCGMVFALIGCSSGENQSPSSPIIQNIAEMGNFVARGGNYQNISAYVTDKSFQVFVPAGDYLVKYGISGDGAYYVAFRAVKSAAVSIGLRPDTTLSSIWLRKGKISTRLGYVWPSGPVTLYSWPGFTSPPWKHVFRPNPDSKAILLYLP
ncbi:MAG: hypothetical protein GY799_01575 [Desulfobulbaceae bacterium]|nr:hypothetical protein [Desulfobulbaceae bacterium]